MHELITNKNILIIGGAGFIGSNLANFLVNKNTVVVVDNFLTGCASNLNHGIKVIEDSACNIMQIPFGIKFDYVFHFGEYSRVEKSVGEFLKCFENTAMTIGHVIHFCRESNCKLIYAGSSTKFADNGKNLSPYTYFKAQNVSIINHFCSKMNIPYAIVYFSNVYGNNEIEEGDYATVVAKFIKAKRIGAKVKVTSPGTQTRAFTHVNDTLFGVLLAAKYGEGDGYIIASEKKYSVLELCDLMQLDYSLCEGNDANRLSNPIDTTMIRELGWVEKENLEQYIVERIRR